MEMEDDLEFEIAEVLSGLKQHYPHRSKIQDDLENPHRSSEVKGAIDSSQGCNASIQAQHSANTNKSTNGTSSPVPHIWRDEEFRLGDRRNQKARQRMVEMGDRRDC
ncbi:protein TIME FOR COFFEE [Raphanus sativus]|nr:protein TIME FOR COFFEE [Raphanus sativus]